MLGVPPSDLKPSWVEPEPTVHLLPISHVGLKGTIHIHHQLLGLKTYHLSLHLRTIRVGLWFFEERRLLVLGRPLVWRSLLIQCLPRLVAAQYRPLGLVPHLEDLVLAIAVQDSGLSAFDLILRDHLRLHFHVFYRVKGHPVGLAGRFTKAPRLAREIIQQLQASRSLLGVAVQTPADYLSALLAHINPIGQSLLFDLFIHLSHMLPIVEGLPVQALVERHPQRPNLGLLAVLVMVERLGGHVGRRTHVVLQWRHRESSDEAVPEVNDLHRPIL